MRRYIAYWPTAIDCQRALALFARARLSHGMGMIDSLIAESAIGLQATLVTFNKRHYVAATELRTEQPYSR